MPLTAKQQRFVAEYAVDLNATQAAIRAGYSAKTASVIGSENLGKPEIASALAPLLAKPLEEAAITAEMIAREAWKIATGGKVEVARVSALSLLSKRHKEFSEKHVVSGDPEQPVIIERRTRSTR